MKQVKPVHCHRRVSRVSCPNGTLAVSQFAIIWTSTSYHGLFHVDRMTAISKPMGLGLQPSKGRPCPIKTGVNCIPGVYIFVQVSRIQVIYVLKFPKHKHSFEND